MKATKNPQSISKFELAAHRTEILKSLAEDLNLYSHHFQKYVVTGQAQRTTWDSKTLSDIPVWEDEEQTIPAMEDVHEWVDVPDDELTNDQLVWKTAVDSIRRGLEDLL